MYLRCIRLCFAVSLVSATISQAQEQLPPSRWIGSWAAAPELVSNTAGLFTRDTTLRDVIHLSSGGRSVRVILSNEFGTEPLQVSAAQIALSAGADGVDLRNAIPLTFSGQVGITIPPNAQVVSDPASIRLEPLSDVAVSLFIPAQKLSNLTVHQLAVQTSYQAFGDVVGEATLPNPQPIYTWPILKGVEVNSPVTNADVLCLGDSITDGKHSTPNTNSRWPNILANRLLVSTDHKSLAVLDLGIASNRILENGVLDTAAGQGALARFDRDVVAQAGGRFLIILEGINDIGEGYDPSAPQPLPPTTGDLIAAYRQMIARAHSHGLSVFGSTIMPYEGALYYSAAGEQIREEVNAWIRGSGAFDGVIDFDAITRDKMEPKRLALAIDSGDHLHPNDAGYKLMGDSVDLRLFEQNTDGKATPVR